MSRELDFLIAEWTEEIHSASAQRCVQALREIAGHHGIKGLSCQVVRLVGNVDDEVRMWAAEALENSITPSGSEATELMRLLAPDQEGEVCYWAATLLGRLGSHASPAVTALETCLRESMYLPARERAAWALSQIGRAAAPAMPTLRQTAISGPPRLQRLAIQALEAIRGVAA